MQTQILGKACAVHALFSVVSPVLHWPIYETCSGSAARCVRTCVGGEGMAVVAVGLHSLQLLPHAPPTLLPTGLKAYSVLLAAKPQAAAPVDDTCLFVDWQGDPFAGEFEIYPRLDGVYVCGCGEDPAVMREEPGEIACSPKASLN